MLCRSFLSLLIEGSVGGMWLCRKHFVLGVLEITYVVVKAGNRNGTSIGIQKCEAFNGAYWKDYEIQKFAVVPKTIT